MFDEVAALARLHDLSSECQQDIAKLLRRAEGRSGPTAMSLLATMVDAPTAVALDVPDAGPVAVSEPGQTGRYEDLGLIGRGGMGEVRRVRDRELNRIMAMKTISGPLVEDRRAFLRFVEEAQATSQLQHPGIVPVHELGRLPDGRFYFTMREIRGRNLRSVLREVHHASARGLATADGGWTFRRLITTFQQVCMAVAYAHSKGVIHRDLKPHNVMVGEFGEALVMDWGLAKVLGRPDLAADAGELDVVVTARSQDDSGATQMGTVAGTPAYMSPEQARGEIDRIDARSDIYSLGAMLYEILTGRPPYRGRDSRTVHLRVLSGPPKRPEGPPEELVDICMRAMDRDPAGRYARASELADAVRGWLDGARQREKALEMVAVADEKLALAAQLRAQAQALHAEAREALDGVQKWEPEPRKAPGWQKQDDAERLERDADMKELEYRETLHTALNYAPALAEGHARLAALNRRHHEDAEQRRDAGSAEQWAALVQRHDRSGAHVAYLKGDGALTLVTDPPGAEVLLHRYVAHNRRLVPVLERSLGTTPLEGVPLAMGSYLCLIRAEGRAEVRYPVMIERQMHWEGVRPGSVEPYPIALPAKDQLTPGECYVPAGWYWSAGDPEAHQSLPRRRLWVDPMVFDRFPVTNRQYIAFLDDLVAQGREDEALRWAPRERGGTDGALGALIYGRGDDGRFELRADADGDAWLPQMPVFMVDCWGAEAYAAWRSEHTGAPWQLPGELEWEKAARGVDGRYYPWGDWLDPSWCRMGASHRGRRVPAVVDSYPVDESVYGLRGMGGNSRDWTRDTMRPDGPPLAGPELVDAGPTSEPTREDSVRVARGGLWGGDARGARIAYRFGDSPACRYGFLGFRLCRPYAGSM